jgi:hypothetical protein
VALPAQDEQLEQLEHADSPPHVEHDGAATVSTTGESSTGRNTVEGAKDVVTAVPPQLEQPLLTAGANDVVTT